MALNRMASALAESSTVYERDNDPEFVRLAAPSTLKTVEILLSQSPRQPQLLLTACRGFTEYSYGFLHVESVIKAADVNAAQDLRTRASNMYRRARAYCLSGLALRHPGVTEQALVSDPGAALRATDVADVPWLYWAAASWGADLVLAPNAAARLTELAAVRALLRRARDLDDTWDSGAIYEALIAFDGARGFHQSGRALEGDVGVCLCGDGNGDERSRREEHAARSGAGDRRQRLGVAPAHQSHRAAVCQGAEDGVSLSATGRSFTL
jgi:hypothetical protein